MPNKLMKRAISFLLRFVLLCALWLTLGSYLNFNYGENPAQGHFDTRWWNDEVSLHFLNTLGRYHFHPIEEHFFAVGAPCTEVPDKPCITSEFADQPQSAVLKSSRLHGEVVYTSFPPGSMIISSVLVFKMAHIFNITPLNALRVWNWLLALITMAIFSIALNRLVRVDLLHRELLIFLSSLPLLIAVEPLHSHHLSLWAHQVFQPLLATVLVVLTGSITKRRSLFLGFLCALGCWIEWSAYFVCIAVFLVICHTSDKQNRIGNIVIFTSTSIAGGLSLLAYYAWLVGLTPYFHSLFARFSARNFIVNYYDFNDWLLSLLQSYGPWLAAAFFLAIAASITVIGKYCNKKTAKQPGIWHVVIFVICFVLLENVLLFEHSIVYTFDRLKWGFLLCLIIAFSGEKLMSWQSNKGLILVVISTLAASVASLTALETIYRPYWTFQ
jgi:hypothetical protein